MREHRSASFCINDKFITTRLSSLRAAHNVASKKIWQKYCMQWQISKKSKEKTKKDPSEYTRASSTLGKLVALDATVAVARE